MTCKKPQEKSRTCGKFVAVTTVAHWTPYTKGRWAKRLDPHWALLLLLEVPLFQQCIIYLKNNNSNNNVIFH